MSEIRYHDADGNECTLDHLCRTERGWAASRIRTMTDDIDRLRAEIQALRSGPCESCREKDADLQALDAENERMCRAIENERSRLRSELADVLAKRDAAVSMATQMGREIERLRAALRPFAEHAENWECHYGTSTHEDTKVPVRWGLYLAARKAMEGR